MTSIALVGGGTGGHLFAAQALAQEFLKQNTPSSSEVLFIGSTQGMEAKMFPLWSQELPSKYLLVDTGKLVKQTLMTRVKTLLKLIQGTVQCFVFLRKNRPDFLISVGGFAAGPAVIAAWFLRIPMGLVEQNAVMGFTNRVTTYFCSFVFHAFPTPPKGVSLEKSVYTGNPIRSRVLVGASSHKAASPLTLFIFGGSQGARGLNKMILDVLKKMPPHLKLVIHHQTGSADYEDVLSEYKKIPFESHVYTFIENMESLYAQAHIVICRAGSSTLTEIAATGSCSILVPLPSAAQNHQWLNAQVFEKAGAALTCSQDKPDDCLEKLNRLLQDEKLRKEMADKARTFFRPHAARDILASFQRT